MKIYLMILFSIISVQIHVFSQNVEMDMNQWYLSAEDGTRLFVTEGGRGDSVIVIHGGWGAEYSYLVPALKPLFNQYHFIFYDQRGSLRSPALDSTVSLQRIVEDLEELRQELGIEKVTLLSHSMGSFIAYSYLKVYPQHVNGIVLISPVLPTGVDLEKKRAADQKFFEFAESNKEKELKEEDLFDKPKLTDKEKTYKWRIGFASGNLYFINRWEQMKGGQVFYNPQIASLINKNSTNKIMENLWGTLKSYSVPMFVIIGDHDLVDFGLTTWPELVNYTPHITLLRLENAGHNSWIDKPGRFKDFVEKALGNITE